MKTQRPLKISCATDSELVAMVSESPRYGPDFRDHLHAEFARRFPYIEAEPVSCQRVSFVLKNDNIIH